MQPPPRSVSPKPLRLPKVTVSLDDLTQQRRRAEYFLAQATTLNDRTAAFDNLVACIYFTRSCVELLREGAKLGQLAATPEEWDQEITSMLPGYHLVHLLRIQDFHGNPLRSVAGLTVRGRFSVPGGGRVALHVDPNPSAPRAWAEGDQGFEADFLLVSDSHVQSNHEDAGIRLVDLLKQQIEGLGPAIERFAYHKDAKNADLADTKVGRVAVQAYRFAKVGATPTDAWLSSLEAIYPPARLPAQKRHTCPKWAFAILCHAGQLEGVPGGTCSGAVSRTSANFALRTLEYLRSDPGLADDRSTLSRRVFGRPDEDHFRSPNGELEVVLALWKAGFIKDSEAVR